MLRHLLRRTASMHRPVVITALARPINGSMVQHRCISVGAKRKLAKKKATAANRSEHSSKLQQQKGFPMLSVLVKKFFMKVHPDLIASASPSAGETNSESMKKMNEFLQAIKSTDADDPYPRAQQMKLTFYLKAETGVHQEKTVLRKVHLVLATNGGNCKGLVYDTLVQFFNKVGLGEGGFKWDDMYWPVKPVKQREKVSEPEAEN